MHLPRWLVGLSMSLTLVLSSALCAGWKWEHFPH
jgi:hypothetical protein